MDFDRITRTVAPTAALLTLDDVKSHVRVDHDDDDDFLLSLIDVATSYIEASCGISLLTQQWRLSLDGFPSDMIRLPQGPIQSVDSITYLPFAAQGQSPTPIDLDTSLYVVDLDTKPAIIARAFFAIFPLTYPQIGSVKVNFTTGFGDTAEAVPAAIKHAAMLLIGHWYENREAVVGIGNRDSPQDMPFAVRALLGSYTAVPIG